MLKTLLIVVVVVVPGVLGLAAFQPETFTVQRQVSVWAAPDKPFALINDVHRWGERSPWQALDPAMKRRRTGPASHGLHTGAARCGHHPDRADAVCLQADVGLCQHGQADRQGFRGRIGQFEGGSRKARDLSLPDDSRVRGLASQTDDIRSLIA